MFFHVKNGSVRIDDTDMDYVSFGKGNNVLIMLPGVSDGLTTVKGMALALALTYKVYARDYSVFVFSRKMTLCATLILGGACDKIVGEAASVELAEKIEKNELVIYKDLGHAAYEEAKDFHKRVLSFLEK